MTASVASEQLLLTTITSSVVPSGTIARVNCSSVCLSREHRFPLCKWRLLCARLSSTGSQHGSEHRRSGSSKRVWTRQGDAEDERPHVRTILEPQVHQILATPAVVVIATVIVRLLRCGERL